MAKFSEEEINVLIVDDFFSKTVEEVAAYYNMPPTEVRLSFQRNFRKILGKMDVATLTAVSDSKFSSDQSRRIERSLGINHFSFAQEISTILGRKKPQQKRLCISEQMELYSLVVEMRERKLSYDEMEVELSGTKFSVSAWALGNLYRRLSKTGGLPAKTKTGRRKKSWFKKIVEFFTRKRK